MTRAAKVQLQVFDLTGRLVRTLYEGEDLSGRYDYDETIRPSLAWDGRDQGGTMVIPGIYLVYLEVKGDSKATAGLYRWRWRTKESKYIPQFFAPLVF